MYPGYGRPQNVMDEYAVTFFALLGDGYRKKNQHYLMLANLLAIPRMESESAASFLKQLEWAAKEPSDILDSSDDSSTPQELKNFFGNI